MEPILENTPNVETVRWAYRFILGREPENEAVLAHWASLADGRVILAYFVQSPEALTQQAAGFPAHGAWIAGPLTADAIQAAYHLRFNASPSAEEIAVEVAAHRSLAAFRRALLASPEASAAAAARLPAAVPQPASAVPDNSGQIEEHGFTVLGQSFTLRGDPADAYWRSLVGGAPDPSLERLARLLNAAFPDGGAGRVLVDAGANIGLTSLAMAIGAPYHADLLCFEPDERNHALLRRNLAAHDLGRARVLPVALAERDGTARLRCGAGNAATSVLIEPHSRAQSNGAVFKQIEVRRLDSVLAEQGVQRLDVLKIDVEGGETSVMLGAAEAMARDKPFIFVEFNLWTQMTVGARNPMEVLEEWRAAFRHMVAFGPTGQPVPIMDHDGLLWVLHTVMTERGSVDDLILCDRLDWLERWN
ncbi:FkbM family methyltransferase [Sediminicoccus sp. KRV36]|uniref:FkbM family methyltransferase n=1 Tax=Sediminicoccus sp. KRV36 TaxID=3133721 RepID=UPI0020106D3F|nr:FkbM family methyltransferase [Sediminicoccus rosea]UPY36789.1 FkbM family methyltransferase [Sediminicoccus rosea]